MTRPLQLTGERVVLREALPGDVDAFVEILAAPEVERWWGPHAREDVVAELYDDPETVAFAVLVDGAVKGLVTYAEETDPDYRHAGIDIAMHPSAIGRGLGADAVRTLARYLLEERPGGRERACDQILRASGFPSRGRDAQLRAGRGRWLARRPAHGSLGRRAALSARGKAR